MPTWIETPALQLKPRAATPQGWADDWFHAGHVQALLAYGELAMFTLMWTERDHDLGLVGRCQTCFDGVKSRQAAAFKQATERKCPDCFGTTYEGGFRAQIVRPVIMADRNVETSEEARGVVTSDSMAIETTGDFTLRRGDYLFRADGTRFQCEEGKETVLRTGFQSPARARSAALTSTAKMDDATSVAYFIPPRDPALLRIALGQADYSADILDLRALETVRPNGYIEAGVPETPTILVPRRVQPGLWSGYGVPPLTPFGATAGDAYLDLISGLSYTLT